MSGIFGRRSRPWRALVALVVLAGGTMAVPLAAPAGAEPTVRTVTDCEPDEGNPLQKALSDSVTGDTVVLADDECRNPEGVQFRMPEDQTITFEGIDLDPGEGVQYPVLNGSENGTELGPERILRAHDVQTSTIRNLRFLLGTYDGNGAAIKVQGNSAPTIENVTFEGNTSDDGGGAISVRPNEGSGTTTIRNNVFRPASVVVENGELAAAAVVEVPNSAEVGGALYVDTDEPIVIAGNTFEDNRADRGGAVYIQSTAEVTLTGNTFTGNGARYNGGGAHIEAHGDAGTVFLERNTFKENAVSVPGCSYGSDYGFGGGGLTIIGNPVFETIGAAAVNDGLPDVSQVDNTFERNVVELDGYPFCNAELQAQEFEYGEYYGGGEMVVNAPLFSRDDQFLGNVVSNVYEVEGGGLSVQNYTGEELPFESRNLVLALNRAEGDGIGGGAYVGGEDGIEVHLLHATITANHADTTGGGLAGGDQAPPPDDDLTLENSILWGNTADDAEGEDDLDGFATVLASSSDLCVPADELEAGSAGNICADPRLADPAGGDVHQTATSPTLDAGDRELTGALATDYEGDARIQDAGGDGPTPARPDMGADEAKAPAPPEPKPEEPKVDANVIAPGSIGEDDGYCLSAKDGGVFTFGGCQFFGAAGGGKAGERVRASATDITAPQSLVKLNAPIVGIAMQPSDTGYWQVGEDGGVFSFGTAPFFGSMGGTKLNNPIVGIATSPTGQGYYLVASDGGVFSFGDAPFLGSMGGTRLNSPIVGITATPSGKGYWLVAADGGVFSFGDAQFHGSAGGIKLNSPIVGMASRPAGLGYWLAAADGGVFTFGDAPFLGNRVGQPLNQPVIGIKGAASGNGYWLIAGDGGVFSYGSAPFLGSEGNRKLNQPVIDMTG